MPTAECQNPETPPLELPPLELSMAPPWPPKRAGLPSAVGAEGQRYQAGLSLPQPMLLPPGAED